MKITAKLIITGCLTCLIFFTTKVKAQPQRPMIGRISHWDFGIPYDRFSSTSQDSFRLIGPRLAYRFGL